MEKVEDKDHRIRENNFIGFNSDFLGYRGNKERNPDHHRHDNNRGGHDDFNHRRDHGDDYEERIKKVLHPDGY